MAGPRRQATLLHIFAPSDDAGEPARFNLANPWPQWIIEEYLSVAGHWDETEGAPSISRLSRLCDLSCCV